MVAYNIDAVLRDPFAGLGKPLLLRSSSPQGWRPLREPEPLRAVGGDVWSRRLTQEHRLVYRVAAERIDVLQARYHY